MRDRLERVRGLFPMVAIDAMVRSRADKIWASEERREYFLESMTYVVGETERAPEIPELARGLLEHDVRRRYLRYKPRYITRQPVRDIEHLTQRDMSRPTVLSFMHHWQYDGMFGSIARHGVEMKALALEDVLNPVGQMEMFRQHFANVRRGAELVSTDGGSAALLEILVPGAVVAIASDVASRTEVTFLNRRVLGASGAPRLATKTDSVVVAVTAHRDDHGHPYLQLHPPLDSRDYETPEDLLDAMLAIHEVAVLAWPEAVDTPLTNFFGRIDD
ncbi:MAG: hypothetical protein JWQ32_2457 [Marmoricola sp.]|nr:hypothetical protein [Marmoricola sp.]